VAESARSPQSKPERPHEPVRPPDALEIFLDANPGMAALRSGLELHDRKEMVGPCGLEPQTSTVSNLESVRDSATPKKSE